MPEELDVQKFLKERGYSDDELKSTFAPPKAAAPKTTPAPAPSAEPSTPEAYRSTLKSLEAARTGIPGGEAQVEGGKGVAKTLAGAGSWLLQQQNKDPVVAPFMHEHFPEFTHGLGNLARRAQAFSQEPTKGPWESAGKVLSSEAPYAAAPFGAGERLAVKGVTKVAEAMRGPARTVTQTIPGFTKGAGFAPTLQQITIQGHLPAWTRRARQIARKVGRGGEAVGTSAATGAAADPEHPWRGAAAGAATLGASRLGGAAFRSKAGKLVGELLAAEGAYYGVHEATGLPFYPIAGPALIWHRSPVSRGLRLAGRTVTDSAGHVLGYVNPALLGHLGGETSASGADPRSQLSKSTFLRWLENEYLPSISGGGADDSGWTSDEGGAPAAPAAPRSSDDGWTTDSP